MTSPFTPLAGQKKVSPFDPLKGQNRVSPFSTPATPLVPPATPPTQPVGQTDPTKVATSSSVKKTITPQNSNTNAQSNAITSMASGGTLTNQLFEGLNKAKQQALDIQTGIKTMTPDKTITTTSTNPTSTDTPNPYAEYTTKGIESLKKAAEVEKEAAQLKKNMATSITGEEHNPNFSLDTGIGRAGAIQQNYGNQLTGLAEQENALTNMGNAYLKGAANAAPIGVGQGEVKINPFTGQPIAAGGVQVPYNNRYLNSATGQPVAGEATGGTTGTALSQLPQDAQTAIQSYAQQIKNGSMTRPDAESRIAPYGIAGTNALNEVLGTGFNTNASNASAETTAIGQKIQTAADSANKALNTLTDSFNSLSKFQTEGIPLTNSISNWIGNKIGQKELSAYQTALSDARSQLIGVLNSSGGSPTGNEKTAYDYLPDNMTKAQFDQKVGTLQNPGIVRQLIQQKVGSYTTSGQQSNQNTGTNNQSTGGTGTSGETIKVGNSNVQFINGEWKVVQ